MCRGNQSSHGHYGGPLPKNTASQAWLVKWQLTDSSRHCKCQNHRGAKNRQDVAETASLSIINGTCEPLGALLCAVLRQAVFPAKLDKADFELPATCMPL